MNVRDCEYLVSVNVPLKLHKREGKIQQQPQFVTKPVIFHSVWC